jgi:hypothetical protein
MPTTSCEEEVPDKSPPAVKLPLPPVCAFAVLIFGLTVIDGLVPPESVPATTTNTS